MKKASADFADERRFQGAESICGNLRNRRMICVSSVFHLWLKLLAIVSSAAFVHAAEPALVDDSASPHAVVRSIGLDEVRWTRGFWAERDALCRRTMVPAMGALMEGTNYTQFLRNFEIAAGLAQGRARGASFNDGDFY